MKTKILWLGLSAIAITACSAGDNWQFETDYFQISVE